MLDSFRFPFEAIDCRGNFVSGSVKAADEEDAERRLKNRAFFVTRIGFPEGYLRWPNLRSPNGGPYRCVIIVCEQCGKQLGATTEMREVICSKCRHQNRVVLPPGT